MEKYGSKTLSRCSCRNADALIGQCDVDIRTWGTGGWGEPLGNFVDPHVICLDQKPTLIWHRLHGIDANIVDDLTDLPWIRFDWP